nr:DUF3833 domain-containing protein [Azospirillum thermophilum]
MDPKDFAGRRPELRIEEYFAGRTNAWGIFEDRFGTLRREFTVTIDGRWDGRELVLDEQFLYSDGETDRRVWRITRTGEHDYEGSAGDVIGTATGKAYGNALNWSYDMDLKVGDGTWRVRFDDWMFLQPGGVLINRANVYRWGVWIGTVTLFFQPEAGATLNRAESGRAAAGSPAAAPPAGGA